MEIPSSAFMGSRYEDCSMLEGVRSKPHGVSSPPRVSGLDDVILRLRERCRALEEVFGDEFVGLVLFGSWARGRLAWVAMLMCWWCSGAFPA
jgi:hypothetical protein